MPSAQTVPAADRAQTFLEVRGINKTYGGVHALRAVDFKIGPGEIVGVVGHNGAGKSTLMNILAGVTPRSGGDFNVEQHRVTSWSPYQAQAHGLRSVFQELSLCSNLTVAENARIVHRSLVALDWRRRARSVIQRALDEIFPGHGIPLEAKVANLAIGTRQMVEIARAFSVTDRPVRCAILDEPTSALGHEATRQLLTHIKRAAATGTACILITHRLDEIMAVCTRTVVMVDGRVMAERPIAGLTRSALVKLMGAIEAPEQRVHASLRRSGRDLVIDSAGTDATDLPIQAASGEIVGFAGLDGHGQRQRLRTLFAAARRKSRKSGTTSIAYVAGDRGSEGVFAVWSIAENLTIRSVRALRRHGLISIDAERELAGTWSEKLKIKTLSLDSPIVSLSGGNQQKVLFARALASDAGVILLDDPMRGVDVNTKQEVYKMLRDQAENGRCFVWYTTELEELTNCDRVYVFREGRAVVELSGEEINSSRILEASFGGGHV